MTEADGDHDVLSHLPRSRPARRSAKRDAKPAAKAKAKAKPRAAAKPRPKAASKPKPKPEAKPKAPAVKPGAEVPPAGWATQSPQAREDAGVDLVGVARQAAGEVVGTVGRLLGRLRP